MYTSIRLRHKEAVKRSASPIWSTRYIAVVTIVVDNYSQQNNAMQSLPVRSRQVYYQNNPKRLRTFRWHSPHSPRSSADDTEQPRC